MDSTDLLLIQLNRIDSHSLTMDCDRKPYITSRRRLLECELTGWSARKTPTDHSPHSYCRPTEVLDMDSTTSTSYVFPCGRSYTEALAALVSTELGASLATLPWVKYHYSLIVWKLACYVRSRPDMLSEWWSWDMVLRQLRYR